MRRSAYAVGLLLATMANEPQELQAQQDTCLRRSLPLSLDTNRELADAGIPVADFQAKVGGKPVKILSVAPDGRPHRIVILLDASGSMFSRWPTALRLVASLVESPLPNSQVALLSYGEDIKERIEFSRGKEAILDWLAEHRVDTNLTRKLVHGRTALLDALVAGLDLLETPTSADSLWLISDGGENASHVHAHETGERLIRSGVRLFVTALYDPLVSRATPEEVNGPAMLADAAYKTGGKMIVFHSGRAPIRAPENALLPASVDLFRTAMTRDYLLEVELPERLRKPRSWNLKLAGDSKKQWKDVQLIYPTQLAACEP